MDNSQKTARAHRALSWLYAFIAVLLAGGLALTWGRSDALPMAAVAVFFGLLFTLHHFISRAALEKKSWARIASIIIGVLFLPGFPVGTAIGIMLLVYAWKPWVTNA